MKRNKVDIALKAGGAALTILLGCLIFWAVASDDEPKRGGTKVTRTQEIVIKYVDLGDGAKARCLLLTNSQGGMEGLSCEFHPKEVK